MSGGGYKWIFAQNQWGRFPWILLGSVTPVEALLLTLLLQEEAFAEARGERSGWFRVSRKRVAAVLQMSEQRQKRAFQSLKKLQLIEVHWVPGSLRLIRINHDGLMAICMENARKREEEENGGNATDRGEGSNLHSPREGSAVIPKRGQQRPDNGVSSDPSPPPAKAKDQRQSGNSRPNSLPLRSSIRSSYTQSKPPISTERVFRVKSIRKKLTTTQKRDLHPRWSRYAQRLFDAIPGKLRTKAMKVQNWAVHFRRLHSVDGFSPKEIRQVLVWYCDYIRRTPDYYLSPDYYPVVACGTSFRKKFDALRIAMEKDIHKRNPQAKSVKIKTRSTGRIEDMTEEELANMDEDLRESLGL